MTDGSGPANVVKLTTLARAARREERALVVDEQEHKLDRGELQKWIVERADPKHKRRQCSVFLLSHDQKGGPLPITYGPTIPKGASPEERERVAREIVEDFDNESENAAATCPDLQRFIVSAFLKEAVTEDDMKADPEFTRSFLVSPPPDVASSFLQGSTQSRSGGGDIDPAAVLGHMQRLTETLAKQNSQNLQAMQERLVSWNTDVMKLNQVLQEKSFQQTLEMEKLADDRAMRDANAVERKMHIDAQYQLFQGLMTYGKAAAEKYLAAKGGPKDAAAGELGPMLVFMKTLEPGQILKIIETLSPAQQEMFWPMASMLVSSMPEEKKQLLGALLKAHQDQVTQAGEDIRITVQKKEGEA